MDAPGFDSSEKLTPTIEVCSCTMEIYIGLTVPMFISYVLAGMDTFDAVSHALSTVSIGGFSTYDQSIGFFNNIYIEIVCIMFYAAICYIFFVALLFDISWQAFKTFL